MFILIKLLRCLVKKRQNNIEHSSKRKHIKIFIVNNPCAVIYYVNTLWNEHASMFWKWKYLQNKIKRAIIIYKLGQQIKTTAIRLLFVQCVEITGHMWQVVLETCKHRHRRMCVEFDLQSWHCQQLFSLPFRKFNFTSIPCWKLVWQNLWQCTWKKKEKSSVSTLHHCKLKDMMTNVTPTILL